MLFVLEVFLGATGCSGDCVADGPPVIVIGDTVFVDDLSQSPASRDDIGDLIFSVGPERQGVTARCDWEPQDGDSSLPVGTDVFEIVGEDPTVAIIAELFGQPHVFRARSG